jgi:hypothetical protein
LIVRAATRKAVGRALAVGLWPWLVAATGCSSTPTEPLNPGWADVAPIFRGECNGCHGWTAPTTGSGYRFDFFEATKEVCGDAALAMESGVILAGSPAAAPQIQTDLLTQPGAQWPRMPPQPSPALPDWERDALERWTVLPIKGPPPPGNRAPNISVGGFPTAANAQLSFTAIIDDPDGDSTIGVIEVNGLAFLMGRPGSFDVQFDSSTWPVGPQSVSAVLCDGWSSASIATIPLGSVQIQH